MTGEEANGDRGVDISRRDFVKAASAAGVAGVGGVGPASAAPSVVQVGEGGYASEVPASVEVSPPSPEYATSNVSAPYPTNDWWSRLLTTEHAETLFSHPLFAEPTTDGLEVGYTDEWDVGGGPGVDMNDNPVTPNMDMDETAYMPIEPDFTVGHTATGTFAESLVDGYGDWHVEYRMGSADPSFDVTQVQGSPYLYLDYRGGGTELTFDAAPTVFEDRGNVLGVTVDGSHYGLFAPEGSSWSGTGSATLTNGLGAAGYATIALLPDDSASTLDTFAQYAHNVVTETTVDWEYVETENGEVVSEVRTTFSITVEDRAGEGGTDTLSALYPHQHKYLATGESLVDGVTYESARGTMKVSQGSSFTTAHSYAGILPNYPVVDGLGGDQLTSYVYGISTPDTSMDQFDGSLAEEYGVPTLSDTDVVDYSRLGYNAGKSTPYGSTYWTGLNFNQWSESAALLNELGHTDRRDLVLDVMKGSFEQWFTPKGDLDAGPDEFDSNLFFYDNEWGTLVGHVGGFNAYEELNDHHFHYGYYVKGASEIARYGDSWADESQYGGMVKRLVREYANPTRGDDTFPFLRNFAPYAGHSFASGVNPFHLGNNQEASSEAIDAYAGLIRWGAFTDQSIEGHSIEELGIFLYTHEIHAALEYWYDWEQENHPDNWDREYASVVWGDGYSHSTWWTEDDEDAYAINVIPANGDTLYLGWDQDHTAAIYDELVQLKGSDEFTKWPGILTEFEGFADASSALDRFQTWEDGNFPGPGDHYVPDMSNSKLHTYTMLSALDDLGSPTNAVVSDATFSHVFEQPQADGTVQRNYVAYNPDSSSTTVTFSDNTAVDVPADTVAVLRGSNDDGDVGNGDDTTSPTVPANLSSPGQTDTSVDLAWDAATDDGTGVDRYVVSVDGAEDHTVPVGTTATTVVGLSAETTYAFAVTAVDGAGNESDAATVSVETAPADTAAPTAPSNLSSPAQTTTTVDLAWDAASDAETGVDRYAVSVDGTVDHSVSESETSTTVTGLSSGTTYEFTVTAVDGAGNRTDSDPASIATPPKGSDQSAYNGPHELPGSVEAEDFDAGGEGVAYHDTTGGNNGDAAYRDADVDVETATENGYNVCWVVDGEWLEYTVQVESDGDYDVAARVASASGGGSFDLSVDGTQAGSTSFGATGGWQAWQTVDVGTVSLAAGTHVVRVDMTANDWNLNWLEFASAGGDTTAPAAPTDPSVTGTTDTSVSLAWSESTSGDVDHYVVYEGDAKITEATGGSATVTGLESATEYTFAVAAVDGAGNESDASGSVTATTAASAQDYTQDATEADGSTLEFSFTPSHTAASVALDFSVDGGSEQTTAMTDGDGDGTWTLSVSGLSGGDTVDYNYTFEKAGNYYDTESYAVTHSGDTSAPTAPANLTSTGATDTTVVLDWDPASDDVGVDHYVVYEGSTAQRESGTASTTVSGLSPETQYTFTVTAVDAAGNESAESNSVTVTTPAPDNQGAFEGTAASVPGQVQAEEFDTGGSGVAYSDADGANNGGAFRSTGVDVESSTGGGYNVGWITDGEWLEYTVDAAAAGEYDVTARVASNAGGGSFAFSVDGTEAASGSFGATGGWQSWQTVDVGTVSLSAGEQVIRVDATASDWNLDWLEFTEASASDGSGGSGTSFAGSTGDGWSATVTEIDTNLYEWSFEPAGDAAWADVHFADPGTDAWVGYRLDDSDGDNVHVYTRDGSADGAAIDFRFVYDDGAAGQYTTERQSFTY